MTVGTLIDRLRIMPQDAQIVMENNSDYLDGLFNVGCIKYEIEKGRVTLHLNVNKAVEVEEEE